MPPFDQHLFQEYLRRLPQRVSLIRRLVAESKWETLKRECERLSRSAPSYGLESIARAAAELAMRVPPAGGVGRSLLCANGEDALRVLMIRSAEVGASSVLE